MMMPILFQKIELRFQTRNKLQCYTSTKSAYQFGLCFPAKKICDHEPNKC